MRDCGSPGPAARAGAPDRDQSACGAGGLTVETPLARATPVEQTRSVGPESAVAVIGGTSGTGGWIMSRATEFDRFARSLGRFHPLVGGDFDKAQWRVAHGNPQVSATSIEGETFAVFLPLGPPRPDGSDTILLATLSRPAARRGIPHRRLDAT